MTVEPVDPEAAGSLLRRLTSRDRRAVLAHAANRPGAQIVAVRIGRRVAAVAATHPATDGPGRVLTHLDVAAAADAHLALLAVLAHTPDAPAAACTWRTHLPGPHPGLPALLAAGHRITDIDIHMATPGAALPAGNAYHPALA